jgi:hypothetical protein
MYLIYLDENIEDEFNDKYYDGSISTSVTSSIVAVDGKEKRPSGNMTPLSSSFSFSQLSFDSADHSSVLDTVITDITENVPVSTDDEHVCVSTVNNIDDAIDLKISDKYTIDIDNNNDDKHDKNDKNNYNVNALNDDIEASRLEYIEKISKISENIDLQQINSEIKTHENNISEMISSGKDIDIDERLNIIENTIKNENEKILKIEKDQKLKIKKNVKSVPQGDFGVLPPIPPFKNEKGTELGDKGDKPVRICIYIESY